jgi:serine protease Do
MKRSLCKCLMEVCSGCSFQVKEDPHEREELLNMSRSIHRHRVGLVALALSLCANAQSAQERSSIDVVLGMSTPVEELSTKVSPAVVHIEVSSYRTSAADDDEMKNQTLAKRQGSGSGVIVDPDGYIITASHVIKGARRIRVELDKRVRAKTPAGSLFNGKSRSSFEARVIGISKEADVAVLKIDAQSLPTIAFSESNDLKQGQLVAALGSPEGLRNSLSLGVVSSVAQQIEPDDSLVYVQTDVALAPGSSGGPLVDIQGGMVGINVFSLTERGREEGLGFAVPSAMVRFVYNQIRHYGFVPRPCLDVDVQGITPTLASALQLPTDSGVIVAGAGRGRLAENEVLQAGDVLVSLDGTPLQNVPQLTWLLLHKQIGDRPRIEIARNASRIVLEVSLVSEPPDPETSIAATEIEENLVSKLGIVGSARKRVSAEPTSAGSRPGVLVVARLRESDTVAELAIGDVIRSVNSVPISSVAQLRTTIEGFKPGDAIALQVERMGKLRYVAFEMD